MNITLVHQTYGQILFETKIAVDLNTSAHFHSKSRHQRNRNVPTSIRCSTDEAKSSILLELPVASIFPKQNEHLLLMQHVKAEQKNIRWSNYAILFKTHVSYLEEKTAKYKLQKSH